MSRPLSSRQEAFCCHFAAQGNAAEAARLAGYAVASARQTGHDLLEKPWIIERVRAIRAAWRQSAREDAQVLLARLEHAWDVAVARESPGLMLQVIRLQAEIAGLSRKGAAQRADLWPTPGEETGSNRSPLATAVTRGRHAAERRFADEQRSRKRLDRKDREAVKRTMLAAIDDRRALETAFGKPWRDPDDSLTFPDTSGAPPPEQGDEAMIDASEALHLAFQESRRAEQGVT